MKYPIVTYVKAALDHTTQTGQWYLWPEGCPMMADKRAAGHPAPMACMGGIVAAHDRLSIFTDCWHANGAYAGYTHAAEDPLPKFSCYRVGCSYLPDRDLWDHPGGKIGVPREPQTSETPPGSTPGDVVRDFLMPANYLPSTR